MRIAVVGALLIGCSSTSTSSSTTPGTFTEIYPLIFPRATKAQCDFCHSLPANEKSNGSLSMGTDRATAYKALVGTKSTTAKCSGKAYVVPGKPDESLFYLKLSSPSCGDRMPLGGDPLTSEQLDMIRSWIANGAQDD